MDSPPTHPSKNHTFPMADKPSQEENPLPLSLEEPITDLPPPSTTAPPLPSPSPRKRSKTHVDVATEDSPAEPTGARRRGKTRAPQTGVSPKNVRRPRRRLELEIREEKDVVGLVDEVGKPRKRRNTVRSKKEKVNLVPPSSSSTKNEEEDGSDLERVGQLVSDLIMWKDVAKSTLWFGFGCICFLSSCFSHGLNFSIFSAISKLGILFLGLSFVSDSFCKRNQDEKKCEAKLKDDDILRLAKLILPTLNFAIWKTRELFSGEPSMTLKVAPFLLLGSEYGHFITIKRLCAIGFFAGFSVPKLYSNYTAQINQRAECLKLWLLEAWCACYHKKKVIALALLVFWNLSSIKTRIYTAFIVVVLFRYLKQHVVQQLEVGEAQIGKKELQQASVVVGPEEKEPQQQKALVVLRDQEGCQN